MRIAVLEDDADHAAGVGGLLEAAGHGVQLFSKGRQLLAKLAHESYDLIVIDWELPDISGVEVVQTARRLMRSWPPTPPR